MGIFMWAPTTVLILLNRQLFLRYKKTLLYSIIAALIFAIPWDIYAVRTGIWYFPDGGNIGLSILGLPLEEYLFMTTSTLGFAFLTIFLKYKFKL